MPTAVTLESDTQLSLNTGPDKYLELLKRSLADLLVPSIRTFVPQIDISDDFATMIRTYPNLRERLAYHIRVLGIDWPESAVTMIGYSGLTILQQCIATILDEDIPGDVIETGVWRGGACIFMREALGDDSRQVWAADSFEGFDPRDPECQDLVGEYFRVSVDQVKENFQRYGVSTNDVVFLEGYFQETLPTIGDQPWSLVRLDGDTYEATHLALDHLYPNLSPGGFVVVDDYGAMGSCKQAVDEFLDPTITLTHGDAGRVYWRKPQ